VAVSSILRAEPTPAVAEALLQLIPGLTFCSLALLADNRSQRELLFVPVLGNGLLQQPHQSCCGTAAWASFASGQTIVWHPDDGSWYGDCDEVLELHKYHLASIVIVPLQSSGMSSAIGAATFAFAAPRAVDSAWLEHFASLLCRAICHNKKNIWEVSLAALIQVLPPKLLRRVLSSSSWNPSGPVQNGSFNAQIAPQTPKECISEPPSSESMHFSEYEDAMDPCDRVCLAAVLAATASLYSGSPHQRRNAIERPSLPPSTFFPLSLEFEDPAVEASYRSWFTTSQCEVDRQLSLVYALMLVVMGFAIWVKGAAGSIAALLTLQIGLGAMVLPGIFQFGWGTWYAVHRASVVTALRLTGTTLVLAHWCTSPQQYAGSLTKALLGRAIGRLGLCSLRQRLPLSAHLMSMMGELYLCALFNSFAFWGGSGGEPGLLRTSLAQSTAALGNAVVTYYLERRTRALFLKRGGVHA